jgi:hypothetical protein
VLKSLIFMGINAEENGMHFGMDCSCQRCKWKEKRPAHGRAVGKS